jgi:putative ABC transport system permease protein
MVAAESLLLAAIGTLFGIVAGLWLGYLLVAGMSVAGFVLDYIFPLTALVWTAVVGLVFGLLAAVLPARQAARMPIIEALRYE